YGASPRSRRRSRGTRSPCSRSCSSAATSRATTSATSSPSRRRSRSCSRRRASSCGRAAAGSRRSRHSHPLPLSSPAPQPSNSLRPVSVAHDFAGWPRGPLHLAIGVFDGVHVGHQALMRGVAERAKSEGATPVAATFDPLPIEVLAPGAPPSALSDTDERCTALERFGAQHIVVFTFTPEFAALTPEEFVERLVGAGDLRRVCVGEDFQFGRDRAGDVRRLAELGKTHGFVCDLAKPVTLDGQVVSSTGIRNALLAGDGENAARLLGRPYAVTGVVEHGSKRGRALGFP